MKRTKALKILGAFMIERIEECLAGIDEEGYSTFNCGELLDFMQSELGMLPPEGAWEPESRKAPKRTTGSIN